MATKKGSWFKRHKILTVFLVIIGLGIVVSVSGSGKNSSGDNQPPGQSNSQSAQTTAKIGESARDGKFEFTVKGIKCNEPSVTDNSGYFTKTAQGQYCLLTLSVKNIGDQQQYFSQGDQKLLNVSGQQFSVDTSATLTKSNNADIWLAQINPGNSVEGTLVFDLPKDQAPVAAQLHDSAFSSGIKIDLQ